MSGKPTFDSLEPMEFGEASHPFESPEWGFEFDYDGYRVLASTGQGARLKTRRGADATGWFAEAARSLDQLPSGYVLDGEVVAVLDVLGRSNFESLQDRARARRWHEGLPLVIYCAFDMLVHKGKDCRGWPLVERKSALAELLADGLPSLLYVQHIVGEGRWLFDMVLALELEGMVAKRLTSVYRSGERTTNWLKIKRKGAVPAQRFQR